MKKDGVEVYNMKNARRQNDLFLHIFKIYTNFLQKCTLGIFLKRIFSTGFTIYCFHFLVVHTVYALQKCHCITKIHLEIFRLENSESTYYSYQNKITIFQSSFDVSHKFYSSMSYLCNIYRHGNKKVDTQTV